MATTHKLSNCMDDNGRRQSNCDAFHGPTNPGKGTSMAVGSTGLLVTANVSVSGFTTLRGAREDLVNGLWWHNIHNAANPACEIKD